MATEDESKTKERIEKSKKASFSSVSYSTSSKPGEENVYELSIQVYPVKQEGKENMERKLRGLFPSEIDKVFIPEDDCQDGCRIFEAAREDFLKFAWCTIEDERDTTRRPTTASTSNESLDEKQPHLPKTSGTQETSETSQNGPINVASSQIHLIPKKGRLETLFKHIYDVLATKDTGCEPLRSIVTLLKEVEAEVFSFEIGYVRLNVRVYSETGLEKLWHLYRSGEVKRRLEVDLPIQGVYIDEKEYKAGCEFFTQKRP